jgi:hypothetical protein
MNTPIADLAPLESSSRPPESSSKNESKEELKAEISHPSPAMPRDKMKLRSACHIYAPVPDTNIILHFSGGNGTVREIESKTKFHPDSAWCIAPDSTVLVCGGSYTTDKSFLNQVALIQTTGTGSRKLADMLFNRSWHGAVFHDENVFVLGGQNQHGVSQPTFEKFSFVDQTWSRLKDTSKPLFKVSVCKFKRSLIYTDYSARTVFTYNP